MKITFNSNKRAPIVDTVQPYPNEPNQRVTVLVQPAPPPSSSTRSKGLTLCCLITAISCIVLFGGVHSVVNYYVRVAEMSNRYKNDKFEYIKGECKVVNISINLRSSECKDRFDLMCYQDDLNANPGADNYEYPRRPFENKDGEFGDYNTDYNDDDDLIPVEFNVDSSSEGGELHGDRQRDSGGAGPRHASPPPPPPPSPGPNGSPLSQQSNLRPRNEHTRNTPAMSEGLHDQRQMVPRDNTLPSQGNSIAQQNLACHLVIVDFKSDSTEFTSKPLLVSYDQKCPKTCSFAKCHEDELAPIASSRFHCHSRWHYQDESDLKILIGDYKTELGSIHTIRHLVFGRVNIILLFVIFGLITWYVHQKFYVKPHTVVSPSQVRSDHAHNPAFDLSPAHAPALSIAVPRYPGSAA